MNCGSSAIGDPTCGEPPLVGRADGSPPPATVRHDTDPRYTVTTATSVASRPAPLHFALPRSPRLTATGVSAGDDALHRSLAPGRRLKERPHLADLGSRALKLLTRHLLRNRRTRFDHLFGWCIPEAAGTSSANLGRSIATHNHSAVPVSRRSSVFVLVVTVIVAPALCRAAHGVPPRQAPEHACDDGSCGVSTPLPCAGPTARDVDSPVTQALLITPPRCSTAAVPVLGVPRDIGAVYGVARRACTATVCI